MTALDIIHAHATRLSSHNSGVAMEVCDALGVDVDEGRYASWDHVAALALTLHALAAHVAAGIAGARPVPPVSLDAVLEAHACPECDEESCVCWIYDDDLPAPVDVHPGERRDVARGIRAARGAGRS